MKLTADALIENVHDLVTLPEIALRIAKIVNDPESSAADVGREISNDAALTARLLRIANSPTFGRRQQIPTVGRAVATIGMRQVRNLTLGLTAIRAFDGIANELVSMETFWRHSLLCASAASHIASKFDAGHSETPFVAGLLHDMGQLVLYSQAPKMARQALLMSVDASEDLEVFRCERKLMGFDHAAVGAALARKWGLPPSLQECIEFHHEPERAMTHRVEVAIIHIANSVAVLAEIGSLDLEEAPEISPAALQLVGMDSNQVSDFVRSTQDSAAELLPVLIAA